MLARNGAGPAAADATNGAQGIDQLGGKVSFLATPEHRPPQDTAFSELARQVRDSHCQVGRAAADVLKYALACGDVLIAAKSRVPHGQWLPWLRRDCELSERTANAYMQLAGNRHMLEANPQHAADLSLRGALRLIPKRGDPAPRPAPNPAAKRQIQNRLDVVDVLGWWSKASITERERVINNIGWTDLVKAIPQDWHPIIRKWFGDGQPTTVNADEEEGADPYPDDLSIPNFLRRT